MAAHIPGSSFPYSPPEFYRGEVTPIDYKNIYHKIDLYGMGMTMIKLMFNEHIFTNKQKTGEWLRNGTYFEKIVLCVEKLTGSINQHVAYLLATLWSRCVCEAPSRMNIEWFLTIVIRIYELILDL